MNRRTWLIVIGVIATVFLGYLLLPASNTSSSEITTRVQKGPFEILVYSSGQIEAQNSEKIIVPKQLQDRDVRIYEINITDIIEEGTVVDSGDYVATLDQKTVEEVLNTAREELETAINEYQDAKMDSNLTLSGVRDQIINAREEVEEFQIVLDESVYESPSIIRKAEMDLDKARRKLEQENNGYALKKRQAEAKVARKRLQMEQRQTRVSKLSDIYNSLVITAPKQGMVTYSKDHSGEKIKVGSTVSPWMPEIATLPDMSAMLSLTYVNEIDISRVKKGQRVVLGIDAIPGKELEGEVVSVANIGQPMPKSDAKVFEVKIRVFGDVSDLKPAMTTSNVIYTATYQDTLFIPAEAVFENDSLQFVYLKKGKIVKQVVDLGDQNENQILLRKGLQAGDELLLTEPEDAEDLKITGLDIYQEIMQRKEAQEAEEQKKIEADKKKPYIPNNNQKGNPSGGMIIFG